MDQKKQRLMRALRQSAQTGQVRVRDNRTDKTETVNVTDLPVGPWDLSEDECREMAMLRVTLNLRNTQHPFHHLTADGTIVTPDPTLEYYLSRFSDEKRQQFYAVYGPTLEQEANAPKAVPVDRRYYGHDMYEGIL